MPSNKKHHYVPQFYLRNFSNDSKSICLYNLNSRKFIEKAPIKTQCYKDYYYGEDGQAEHALCHLENKASFILREIINKVEVPRPFTRTHGALVLFIAMQYSRTQGAADEYDDMTNRLMSHMLKRSKPEGITADDIDKVNIHLTNAVAQSLRNAVAMYPLLLDLRPILLHNKTSEPFITSDNPVIFYNQLFEERKFISNTGLQSIGLQILLPLSPSFLLMFFDKDVYGLGRRNRQIIDDISIADVQELNELQVLNAVENIYFDHVGVNQYSLSKQYTRIAQNRRREKSKLHSQVEKLTETKEKELIVISRVDIKKNLRLSFMKMMPKSNCIKNNLMYRAACRDEKLVEEFHKFDKLADRGFYGPADFLKYLADRSP